MARTDTPTPLDTEQDVTATQTVPTPKESKGNKEQVFLGEHDSVMVRYPAPKEARNKDYVCAIGPCKNAPNFKLKRDRDQPEVLLCTAHYRDSQDIKADEEDETFGQ